MAAERRVENAGKHTLGKEEADPELLHRMRMKFRPSAQRFLFFLLICGILTIPILAQTEKRIKFGTFSLYFENDFFAGTDRCFTGGVKLSWVSKDLENYHESSWLQWLPFVDQPEFQHAISLSLGQNINTPDDITRSDLVVDDRPYAGWFYLEFGIHSKGQRRMDTLAILLGLIGPQTFSEDLQKLFHNLVGGIWPEGWHHQLKSEFTAGLHYERKLKWLHRNGRRGFGFDFIPHMGSGIGNVYTYANAGFQGRMGWNLPADFGVSLLRPGGESNVNFSGDGTSPLARPRFGIHAFAALDGRLVLRDIFLDGNTLRRSHHVDKNLFTADILAGVRFTYGRFDISYTYVYWTKHFKTEKRGHIFGMLCLSYSL
ncbi:MAG: lipid A deacylase LpxR family protein [Candidatus Aminicenantales bacterium]